MNKALIAEMLHPSTKIPETEVLPEYKDKLLRLLAVAGLWFAEQVFYKIELSDQSLDNLKLAGGVLETEALITYANHRKFLDALYIVVLLRTLWPNMKKAGVPMAEKYARPNLNYLSSLFFAPIAQLMKVTGIQFLPTQQGGITITKPLIHSDDKQDRGVFGVLDRFIKEGKGRLVGINPEATRNSEPGLLPFSRGLAFLMTSNKDTQVMPIGFIYDEKKKTLEIRVGKTFTFHDLAQQAGSSVSGLNTKMITERCRQELSDLLSAEVKEH